MKQKLQQKEKMLIEKEKQLTELKAEKWSIDKEHRQKLNNVQKENMERLKLLQVIKCCLHDSCFIVFLIVFSYM